MCVVLKHHRNVITLELILQTLLTLSSLVTYMILISMEAELDLSAWGRAQQTIDMLTGSDLNNTDVIGLPSLGVLLMS